MCPVCKKDTKLLLGFKLWTRKPGETKWLDRAHKLWYKYNEYKKEMMADKFVAVHPVAEMGTPQTYHEGL